jgi:hypothetical protein
MAKLLDVEETVTNLEHDLARIKLVTKHFPNVKMKQDTRSLQYEFSDKTVKTVSPKAEFEDFSYAVRFSLVSELELNFNGAIEIVKVYGEPRLYTIAKVQYDYNKFDRVTNKYYSQFVFSKPFTCRDKVLQKRIQDECRLGILKFIQAHPETFLDKATLDPRLAKLIIFT